MGSGWDNDSVLNLIREFEKRPVLWKRDHKMYYNVAAKEEAWRELSEACGEDVDNVKRKIESLRGTRRKEKNRILHSFTSGNNGEKNVYVSKWFAWESLKFLNDAGEIGALPTNFDVIDTKNEGVDEDNDKNGVDEETITDEDIKRHLRHFESDYDHKPQMDVPKKRFVPQKQVLLKRKHEEHPRNHDTFRIMQDTYKNDKKDECAIFGDFVSEKMRKLDSRTRSILQFEFHNLLFQAEMGTLPSIPKKPSKLLKSSENAGRQIPQDPLEAPGPSHRQPVEDDDPLVNMKVEPEEVKLNQVYIKPEPAEDRTDQDDFTDVPDNIRIGWDGDDIDTFFEKVVDTVKQLPDDLALEARQRIAEMLQELQARAVKKEMNHQQGC